MLAKGRDALHTLAAAVKGFIVLRRFTLLISRSALAVLVVVGAARTIHADESNHPVLNSFGRFWGVGWSHGYHSPTADGRFQAIKDRHPASMYASSALTYPYQSNYASTPSLQGSMVNPVETWPYFGSVSPEGAGSSEGAGMTTPIMPPTKKLTPAKPAEPPPAWLKPYLREGQDSKASPEHSLPNASQDDPRRESSPSDVRDQDQNRDDDLLLPQTNLTPLQRYYQARRYQGLRQ